MNERTTMPRNMLHPAFLAILTVLCIAANAPTSHPAISPIDLKSSIWLLNYTLHVTIASDGTARSVEQIGDKTEIHAGTLNPAELQEVSALFAKCDQLESDYPTVPDGPMNSLQFGKRTFKGGHFPKDLAALHERIESL